MIFRIESWLKRRRGNRGKTRKELSLRRKIPAPQVTCLKTSQTNSKKKYQVSKVSSEIKRKQMKSYQKWQINKWLKKVWSKWKEIRKRHFCKWSKTRMESLRNTRFRYPRRRALILLFLHRSKSLMNIYCHRKYRFIVWENKRNKDMQKIKVDQKKSNMN